MALSSCFEVKISPRRTSTENEDTQVLTLAAFSCAPKLIFKNIIVGQEATKSFVLRNPKDVAVEVHLTKFPPPDFGMSFNFLKCTLLPGEAVTLSVAWQPKEEGKWVHTVQVKTSSLRSHFTVICSSAPKKMMRKRENRSKLTSKPANRKLQSIPASTVKSANCTATTNSKFCTRTIPVFKKDKCPGSPVVRISKCQTPATKEMPFGGCSLKRAGVLPNSEKMQRNYSKVPLDLLNLPEKADPETNLNNISSETYPVLSPRSPSSLPESVCIAPESLPLTKFINEKREKDFLDDIVFSPISCPKMPSINSSTLLRNEKTVSPDQNIEYLVEKKTYTSTQSYTQTTTSSTSRVLSNEHVKEDQFYDVTMSPLAPNYPYKPKPHSSRDTFVLPREVSFLSQLDELSLFNSVERVSRKTIEEKKILETPVHEGGVSPRCKRKLVSEGDEEFPKFLEKVISDEEEIEICKMKETIREDEFKLRGMFSPLKETMYNTLDRTDTSIIRSTSYYMHSQKKSRTTRKDIFTPSASCTATKPTGDFTSEREETSKRRLEFENFKLEMSTPVVDVTKPKADKNVEFSNLSDLFSASTNSEKLSSKTYTIDAQNGIFYFSPHHGENFEDTKENTDVFNQRMSKKYPSGKLPSKTLTQISAEKEVLTFSPPRRGNHDSKENARFLVQKSAKKYPSDRYTPLKSNGNNVQRGPLSSRSIKKSKSRLPIAKLVLVSKKRALEKPIPMNDAIVHVHARTHATTINPFLDCNVYYDQEWYDARAKEFVQWLNVLLTPPEQLNSSDEIPKVDVASLWEKSCRTAVAPAPSREFVSCRYHVNHRLDSLRRAAYALFRDSVVSEVLAKVVVQVDKGILSIRKDRNLVRDLGLKYSFIEMLLCYNPLWLRIGLETIFGRAISLESNSDRIGLTGFIANNFLSDPYLTQKYAVSGVSNMFKPGYDEALMKFILKKVLMLVYFLDYAKESKLIVHNPCLFCRNAQYKESRDVLIALARDFLSGIGDITRHLKKLGYVVNHKQTYLDEFNYAVTHLGSDLRDGVRLSRVVEIILGQNDLSKQLRTPAVSKLQKVHNVKVSLVALKNSGHILEGSIEAKDIAEGHREKTMSLLWQIIYKFQFPRYNSAAVKIQKWFRSLNVFISRRIWLRKAAEKRRILEERSCIVIQRCWREYAARKHMEKREVSALKIQKWFRCVKLMKRERDHFLKKRNAAIRIQSYMQEKLLMKNLQISQEKKERAAKKICVWLYNVSIMKKERNRFLLLKHAAITIQHYVRATFLMKRQRNEFLNQKAAAVLIQQTFRAIRSGRRERSLFLEKKSATLKIQSWYRATSLMREQKHIYAIQKAAAVTIQAYFRCVRERTSFKRKIKAAISIQQYYRGTRQGHKQRMLFLKQRDAAVKIQRWFRTVTLMKKEREKFSGQKEAVVVIQRWYRNLQLSKLQRSSYMKQRIAAINIQRWFRGTTLMKKERDTFLAQKQSAVAIQFWFRNMKLGNEQRLLYLTKQNAATHIQRWFRATASMKKERESFIRRKYAAMSIQSWYRATKLGRHQRELLIKEKDAAVKIQKWFRAETLTRKERRVFCEQKFATVSIQRWYRSVLLVRQLREFYISQRGAATKIQVWYRATALMRRERHEFIAQKLAAVIIQEWYRSMKQGRQQRSSYLKERCAVMKIQRWYRAVTLMKNKRTIFLEQKKAVVVIQRRYRNVQLGRQLRSSYMKQRIAAIKIQRWFRATKVMKKRIQKEHEQRSVFLKQRGAVITIQKWFRLQLLKRRKADIFPVEIEDESTLLARQELAFKNHCAVKIQAFWRGYHVRKQRKVELRRTTVVLDNKNSLRSMYLDGLRYFLPGISYSTLIAGAQLVESGLRLSPILCEEFILSDNLKFIMYHLYTANRSDPAEKLVHHYLRLLIIILRHPVGAEYIIQIPNSIEVLLHLSMVWSGKKSSNFCLVCTIWWLLGQDPQIAEMIRAEKSVQDTLFKCYKKEADLAKVSRQRPGPSVLILPKKIPGWHPAKKTLPNAFLHSKFAIIQVFKTLKINLNEKLK